MNDAGKITLDHRRRQAVVYVRQSSMAQVHENTESLERQYELSRRAVELGWDRAKVVVVDEDLGRSGSESTTREGFKSLVAAVGLGEVGLVLGIEVSRLARNNADWYQLLDLCSLTDTLIADADGLYHPSDHSDRLLLGLKGTMSEAELHLLRGRLLAGMRHKAQKGELRVPLPVGYDYDAENKVVLCRDEAEREAVTTIFRRFEEHGSARQVLLSFLGDGLDLPRRRPKGRVEWARPTLASVYNVLTNPCYAGAFAFGRTRTVHEIGPDGVRVTRKRHKREPDKWSVLIRDHHAGYVSFETFEANLARLAANSAAPKGERRRGAPRGFRAAPGVAPVRTLRADDAGRLLRLEAPARLGEPRRLVTLRVQPLRALCPDRTDLPELWRPWHRASGDRRGVRGAAAGRARGHPEGAHRGRRRPLDAPRALRGRARAHPL
jgi:DNA invertase Pin-like site-specific DNA recombinase